MIFCASPSTMAVLPTPASPISTGLFLVRRDNTWITRSTSDSRPITGSSLSSVAARVRSRPYFSSTRNLLSALGSVTRWPLRICVIASAMRSLERVASRRMLALGVLRSLATASSICSVLMYSSFMRIASS